MENIFCFSLLICEERMVNLKERRKKYSLPFFQSRGSNTSQVVLWGIFDNVFGVALCLFFPPRMYENV